MISKGKILVVDDDPDILETVDFLLSEAEFEVVTVENAQQALDAFAAQKFDLVVVDLRLPGMDGLALTRALKEQSEVGIIILSGLSDPTDRVIGLEIGADDYLSKPFETRELLARVRSVLRRLDKKPVKPSAKGSIYVFADWRLDAAAMSLTSPGNKLVDLTSGEFQLLLAFVERPNRVLSREQILDYTHQNDTPAFDRSVDVQLGRLRRKIEENPNKPTIIKTIRNGGYMFTAVVTNF